MVSFTSHLLKAISYMVMMVLFLASHGIAQAAPVHEAAHTGQLSQLEKILADGVDVDSRDSYGGTALHAAMFQDNIAIVELLLAHKFDPNAIGPRNGYTPLHDAVWANNIPAARLLLKAGARTDIKGHDGLTPVAKAIAEKKLEMAELLKAHAQTSYDPKARFELSHNDIKAFVYAWFAKFDHQVPLAEIMPHLPEPVDMAFPDFPIRSQADFERWYQGVIDTIQWNSHDISNLMVSGDEMTGWTVSFDIRWQARTYKGDVYDVKIHQDWDLFRDGTAIKFKRHRAKLL